MFYEPMILPDHNVNTNSCETAFRVVRRVSHGQALIGQRGDHLWHWTAVLRSAVLPKPALKATHRGDKSSDQRLIGGSEFFSILYAPSPLSL